MFLLWITSFFFLAIIRYTSTANAMKTGLMLNTIAIPRNKPERKREKFFWIKRE